jgi:hypothetical protein
LLDLRHEVITLTNSLHRANPFGESIKAFPYNFSALSKVKGQIDAKSFRCITEMTQVRQFYVDNPAGKSRCALVDPGVC